MALPDVELDNRGYLDLVNELKRRIPAYTPEWTDYNESDPGIALIELFSWLADILIYRINQIPDKAYVRFLQMLNIQLALPAAAQAYLTFTLTSQDLPQAVVIGAGIQVGLSNAAAGPVIFETTADLPAVGAGLAADANLRRSGLFGGEQLQPHGWQLILRIQRGQCSSATKCRALHGI